VARDALAERAREALIAELRPCAATPEAAPYDGINVAATARDEVPRALIDQLAPHGRLVAPVDGGLQRLVLVERRDGVVSEPLEGVRFVPLVDSAS
jgi:protein-L-isoaspartate(D-aspartate) O-methyltransferase